MTQDTIVTPATRTRQAQNAALDWAWMQARLGSTPVLVGTELLRDSLRETWRVASRTTDGQVYHVDLLVDRRGVVTTHCDCKAGSTDRCCWHRGLARLAHRDAIALTNEVGYRIRPKPQPVTAAELSGKRVAS